MTIFRFAWGFGAVSAPGVDGAAVFDQLCEVSVAADEAGIEALFVPDHVWQNDRGGTGRSAPMLETYTLLGALAARTTKVKLGALVSPVTFRNPAILAKIVTTLDVISHGRAILGLGAGWDEEEHVGYGIDFPPTGERMDRLEESLQIAKTMFNEDAPTFAGKYYSIAGALNVPRPISTPIPILVGGGGEKRTLRLVAQYADACNLFGDATAVRAELDVLDRHCEQVGRDPSTITKTAGLRSTGSTEELLDGAGKLAAVGINGFILVGPIPTAEDVHRIASSLIAEFGTSA